jgi:hypothetical protein
MLAKRPAPASGNGQARPRPSVRRKAWLGPLLLAAASSALVVLALVGAEAVARRIAPGYLVERRGLHVYSDTLGWTARRGATAVIDGRKVTINARGYRGHALALPKPPGLTRVVVLGDSIAFGLGVADGETFAALLQARDNGIEAGNMAVQGYGPGQSLLVLRGEGLRARPDAVVMAFCLDNDFADALLSVALYDGRWRKPRYYLDGDRLALDSSALALPATRRVLQWLSDSSYLFNRVSTLGPRPASFGGAHWTDRKREALRDEGYALRLSLAIVRRMDALCRERGIPFVLAAFPHWFTYRSKPWLPDRFLESLRAEGITVLDMADRFVARGETFRAIALDGAGHLSPLGHAIAAEELESAIAALARPSTGASPGDRGPGVNGSPGPRSPRSGAGAP